VGQCHNRSGPSGSISIKLQSLGDENALGFSLWFDSYEFQLLEREPGQRGDWRIAERQHQWARFWPASLRPGVAHRRCLPCRLDEIPQAKLQPSMTATGSYAVSLADQPVRREVSDAKATLCRRPT